MKTKSEIATKECLMSVTNLFPICRSNVLTHSTDPLTATSKDAPLPLGP